MGACFSSLEAIVCEHCRRLDWPSPAYTLTHAGHIHFLKCFDSGCESDAGLRSAGEGGRGARQKVDSFQQGIPALLQDPVILESQKRACCAAYLTFAPSLRENESRTMDGTRDSSRFSSTRSTACGIAGQKL